MTTIVEVFDPAMCCATGVCGDNVDPALATFAGDLEWASGEGASVRRYNLGQEPGAFAEREAVRALLHESPEGALPIVMADGTVKSSGRYPSREELAEWAGLQAPTTLVVSDELIAELAAIGAAIGANCEPCFTFHYGAARKLGLSNTQIALAVKTAQAVKDVPAGKVIDQAAKLLHVDASAIKPTATPVAGDAATGADAGACCAPADNADAASDSACCTPTAASPQLVSITAAPTSAACDCDGNC